MPSLKHIKSWQKLKRRSSQWFAAGSELLSNKLEKLMIVCHGYNKMQPIKLSKGVGTMLPNKSLMLDDETSSGQQQFYPCLGSRRIRNDRNNTILESEGKLYVDNVHLKLNNSDSASSNGLPVDIYEQITENVKVSSDNLHETCCECFQKIEDAPLRNCIVAVSPNRIRRRRLSRQFSA